MFQDPKPSLPTWQTYKNLQPTIGGVVSENVETVKNKQVHHDFVQSKELRTETNLRGCDTV
jgi:hypothetical protein